MLPIGKTVGELQNEPMSAWGNEDIIIGLEFCATMQLRTPLRVLSRHREIHTERAASPPKIALEMWEGIWMPKTKTYRDLGIDVDEPKSTMASDIGPIPSDGGDYLKFLFEVRQAVESEGSIEQRRKALASVLSKSAWQKFVRILRGTDAILNYFFPPFMGTIQRVPAKVAAALSKAGYVTPDSFSAATDKELLALNGVGPTLVKAIQAATANAPDPNSRYVDCVKR